MGHLIREFDWGKTPLGPIGEWPQSLKTVVRIMLDSRYAMWMGWGKELTFFYNDAYARDTLGKKHPWALGRPANQVWAEIWADIGPRIERVLSTGEATWDEGLLLFLERSGYPEETYHTFSYSPLYDDEGKMGGMFCVVTEETNRIIAERRVALLRDLASALTATKTENDVFKSLERCLNNDRRDLPFTLTCLFDPSSEAVRLAACSGMDRSHPAAAMDGETAWPFRQLLQNDSPLTISDLSTGFPKLPAGPWPNAPNEALLVPIAQQGQSRPAGVFVAGLNPHRLIDEDCRGFIDLLVGQIATAIANARAAEEERRRAAALAELDRAKTTFFSNISHELRTPLTLMLSPLEDLLNKPESQAALEDKQLVTVAHRNAVRLLKLVNTLLDFSRIEAGRIQAIYEPVDLGACTAELASVFRSAMEKAGLKLTLDCPPLPEPVYIDRDMWEKIVLNLLSNAFKFTLEGGVTVSLQWGGEEVKLSVADSGVGIPPSELPNLFERFHRVRGTKARSHEGTGIGLALVQELVRLHGGSVQVESREGAGTTFTVRIKTGTAHLPADRVRRSEGNAPARSCATPFIAEAMSWSPDSSGSADSASLPPARSSTELAQPLTHAPRVLLADDNADMREYVRRLLAGRYQVETAADGEAALAAARARRPDLVLTDVMMPRLNGFELLAALRSQSDTRTIPVIMLSARAGEEARVEGLDAGADDYLIKPFSARELLARVASQLEMNRLRRDREEEVTRILESIGDGFQALDANWRFTYMNTAARRMLEAQGLDPDHLIGKHFFDDVFPQTRGTEVEEQFRRAMEDRVAVRFENYYASWQRWYSIRAYPVAQGGITIYFGDITSQKRGEEAVQRASEELKRRLEELEAVNAELREARRAALHVMEEALQAQEAVRTSQQQLQLVTDTAPVAIAHCDTEARFKFVNKVYAERLGLQPKDCIGKRIPEVIGERAYAAFVRYVEKVLSGRPVEFEAEIPYPAFGTHFMRCSYAPEFGPGGQVIGFVAAITDITERRKMEETLRENEAVLRTVTSEAQVGLVMVNKDRRYRFANNTYAEILGLPDQDIVGKRVSDALPNIYDQIQPRLDRAFAGERVSYELRVPVHPVTGKERFYEVVYEPRVEQVAEPYVVVVIVDITERKKMQQTLEQTVEERTARLRETVQQLETFSYSIVHDMRAPLRSMRSFSGILHNEYGERLDAEGRKYLQRIMNSAARMDALITDVLNYSRISQAGVELRPVDLDKLATDMIAEYPQFSESSASIEIQHPLPRVCGNEALLTQVVSNLIGNALKFVMPSRAPRVVLRAEQHGQRVRVWVEDNGIGVAPQNHEKIFVLFHRLHRPEEYAGTGVGLAIVKRAVERMGGSVGVESTLNEGSQFWFELPVAD